jgi:hypothetical protein
MRTRVLLAMTIVASWCGSSIVRASQNDDGYTDPRNIRTGRVIPDEGYCDQPYVVINKDGSWLCTFTTGPGREGQGGQHVVATLSKDQGRTWSPPVDIEPSDGPAASWVMPLITPAGRVYAFYDYNGDRVSTLGDRKNIRADMLGWYCYKYSDDGGRTWSKRYRLPVRETACDRANQWGGKVQIFWGIGKPVTQNGVMWFGFTKLGRYILDDGEGWFFRSDNILHERDVDKIRWEMLPEGEHGLRNDKFGSVQEEHNLVPLSKPGHLYCVYRTTTGYPCHAYSRDGGRTWTTPEQATYTPGGRRIKTPRACPRLWKTKEGKYLLWFHNHSGKTFDGRNPAWLVGGVEKDALMHWGQPEVLLYDPDPKVRMSYPDLIEQDGRYWVTETQKEIARVHEIDKTLLAGLWSQGHERDVVRDGLVLDWPPPGKSLNASAPATVPMPRLPVLHDGGGFSIGLWVRFDSLSPGQVLVDGRGEQGQGVVLETADEQTVCITLRDGEHEAHWACDPGVLEPGKVHHIVVTVDGGPKIITFVIDGVLCDGGEHREYGWGRFPDALRNVNGNKRLTIGPCPVLYRVRLYGRPLRTSEAIANFHAGT